MISILGQLQRSFRIADAADILLVALFLYMFFLWFRSTAFRALDRRVHALVAAVSVGVHAFFSRAGNIVLALLRLAVRYRRNVPEPFDKAVVQLRYNSSQFTTYTRPTLTGEGRNAVYGPLSASQYFSIFLLQLPDRSGNLHVTVCSPGASSITFGEQSGRGEIQGPGAKGDRSRRGSR